MRAVVFEQVGKLSVQTLPDPTPGPKDLIIEVSAVGICGTDVHLIDGEFEGATFPIIPGHEVSGIVVDLGKEVKGFAKGDKVTVNNTLTCMECEYCLNGRSNLCRKWEGMGVVGNDGGSAEFMKAPAANCYKLAESVDLNHAALIEPLACAVRGYDQIPRDLGKHFLVYGAGTMGLMMAQLAPRAGAVSVTIVDTNASRLEAAREVGIETRLGSANDASREQWDVVIDCTGVIPAIEDGLTRVKPGGTFLHFGVAAADKKASYSPFRVYRDEINITGTMASLSSFDRAVALFEAGALKPTPMISHYYSLDDYAGAMDMFRKGTGRKLQIRPGSKDSGTLL